MFRIFFELKDSFKERFDPKKRGKINSRFKIILILLNKIFSIPLYVIFKLFNLKLFSSSLEALGHQVFDLESFIEENKEKNISFKLLISIDKLHIANRHFFLNYQKKNIKCIVVKDKFLSLILNYQKKNSHLIFDSFKYTANEEAKSYELLKNKFIKNDFYNILKSDLEFGNDFLKKKNIYGKKIVLIHARDKFYRPHDEEELRNSSIEILNSSIDWLIKNDYSVIRVGHHGSKNVKLNKKVIDLTDLKNHVEKEILSIFLSNICEIFIGSSSGAKTFAAIFGKPILTINSAPLSHSLEFCKYGISLPKLYKMNNKILKFKEVIDITDKEYDYDLNLNNYRRDSFYSSRGIEFINNNEENVLEATKEIIQKKMSNDFKENENQLKFRKILSNSYCKNALGSISSTFIEKNKELLE